MKVKTNVINKKKIDTRIENDDVVRFGPLIEASVLGKHVADARCCHAATVKRDMQLTHRFGLFACRRHVHVTKIVDENLHTYATSQNKIQFLYEKINNENSHCFESDRSEYTFVDQT